MSAFGGKADIGRVLTEIKNTGDRAEVESLATAVFFESQRTRGDNSGPLVIESELIRPIKFSPYFR